MVSEDCNGAMCCYDKTRDFGLPRVRIPIWGFLTAKRMLLSKLQSRHLVRRACLLVPGRKYQFGSFFAHKVQVSNLLTGCRSQFGASTARKTSFIFAKPDAMRICLHVPGHISQFGTFSSIKSKLLIGYLDTNSNLPFSVYKRQASNLRSPTPCGPAYMFPSIYPSLGLCSPLRASF